jgi:hypothetical protein
VVESPHGARTDEPFSIGESLVTVADAAFPRYRIRYSSSAGVSAVTSQWSAARSSTRLVVSWRSAAAIQALS